MFQACRGAGGAFGTFSSRLALGRMLVIGYERASPLWETLFGGSPATSSPFRRIRPDVGLSTPVRQLKKVDLPAPFGPMMARISPRSMEMLTLLTDVKPQKCLVSHFVRRLGPTAAPMSLPHWA